MSKTIVITGVTGAQVPNASQRVHRYLTNNHREDLSPGRSYNFQAGESAALRATPQGQPPKPSLPMVSKSSRGISTTRNL